MLGDQLEHDDELKLWNVWNKITQNDEKGFHATWYVRMAMSDFPWGPTVSRVAA